MTKARTAKTRPTPAEGTQRAKILTLLSERPDGLTYIEIGAALDIDPGYLPAVMIALEGKGLVAKELRARAAAIWRAVMLGEGRAE